MSFRSWLAGKLMSQSKGVSPRSGRTFSEEDRESSAAVRRMQAQMRQRERMIEMRMHMRQLEEMERELDTGGGKDGEDVESYALKKLVDLAEKRLGSTNDKGQEEYDDDSIRAWLKKQKPKQIAAAKEMDEEDLRAAIKQQMPNLPEKTIARAIEILDAEF